MFLKCCFDLRLNFNWISVLHCFSLRGASPLASANLCIMSYYHASKHSPGAEVGGPFPYPLPPPAAYTHPIQEFTRKNVSYQ